MASETSALTEEREERAELASALVTAAILSQHFGAYVMWPYADQPVLLPWTIILGEQPESCACGMRH